MNELLYSFAQVRNSNVSNWFYLKNMITFVTVKRKSIPEWNA